MESRWASIAGIRGHVRVAGEGRPIVLVHGLAVSSRYFVPLARRLALRQRAVAPDLPGYGRSATPIRALDIPRLASALLEWMDVERIAIATVVGNSVGCQVAVELAAESPHRVERLVLIGPTMDPAAPTMRAQLMRLMRDVVREPIGLNLAELRDYVRMGPRRILATARYALDDPFASKLSRVAQPALVVRGERDAIVSQAWAAEVAARLPSGRLAVVTGAPHAAHWAAADSVALLIEEFQ